MMKRKADIPAFDDDGNATLAEDFPYDVLDAASSTSEPTAEDERRIRHETIIRLIQRLTTGATARMVAQRVLIIAHLLHIGNCRTQKQLARRLGITQGQVSKGIKRIRASLCAMDD